MAVAWVDVGQEKCVDLIDTNTRAAVPTVFFGHWGSGSTAPAVTQTALVTPNAESRASATTSQPAANTCRWAFTLTATAARTVVEAGVFDASSAGNMWLRATHGSLSLETSDQVSYTFDLVLKDSSE
jgi:hypothetical protein